MPQTTNSKLPYPASTDTADVPRDIQNLAAALDQIAYTETTVSVTVTGTTLAAAQTVAGPTSAVTFDGTTPVWVHFFAPHLGVTAGDQVVVEILEDTTSLGIAAVINSTGGTGTQQVDAWRRRIPAAGSHTYTVKAYHGTGASTTFNFGVGGAGVQVPGFVRVIRA